ncbi:hypothetical protein [Sphingomonas bacterium]|uniref:hypothetical protein n=1 Tax=Sphingomonas bacterium TaxID=1895847 RepID=UPI001576D27C|nr:hypothetical protein [Sphingomonas bacterium]
MSVGSTLKHALGFIAGILIPGTSVTAVDAVHEIQQTFANLFGEAATQLAEALKVDTTGLSGPEKVFYIAKALVATAKAQGFKGDEALLETVTLDLAQTAYRNSLPTIEADAVSLLAALHLSPVLTAVATLVLPTIETKLADLVPAAPVPALVG